MCPQHHYAFALFALLVSSFLSKVAQTSFMPGWGGGLDFGEGKASEVAQPGAFATASAYIPRSIAGAPKSTLHDPCNHSRCSVLPGKTAGC